MKTITIYTFESKVHTYYIDFTEENQNPYQVCEDEISRAARKTLGEALEYIMLRIGQSDWKRK